MKNSWADMLEDPTVPDWVDVVEWEQDYFNALAGKLKTDAKLTRDERDELLLLIRGRPKLKSGPGRPANETSWWLGLACVMSEAKGVPTKVAVDAIARKNNVSTRTIYAARKRLLCK